jgi:hypothetical protein
MGWTSALLLLGLSQDGGYRIDVRLGIISEDKGSEAFAVLGETDLPDGATLQIDLFRGETTEGLGFRSRRIRVRDGAFRAEFKVFPGGTPPGKYVARIWFHPQVQDDAVRERARGDGRDVEVRALARLEIGTFETFVAARMAHIESIGSDLDAIVAAMSLAVAPRDADREAAVEECRRAIRETGKRRESQAVLDFHFGVLDLSRRFVQDLTEIGSAFLRELGSEAAAGHLRLAEDKARDARFRLGLAAPVPATTVDMVRELASILRVLVDEKRDLQNRLQPSSLMEPRLSQMRERISQLNLQIAAGLRPEQYEGI